MRIKFARHYLALISLVLLVTNLIFFCSNFIMNTDAYLSAVLLPLPVDETPPTVTLNGGELITIAIGSSFDDPGVEAYDDRTEVEIFREGEVDTDTLGDYTIQYTVKDEHDNTTTVARTVKVIEPTGVIYLTFDDGPGAHTARLLDILKKYGIKATFFVTGFGDDDLILREFKDGHTVALHSYTHDYSYVYSSIDNFFTDLKMVQDRVKSITGQAVTLIRFPGGSSNLVSTRYDGGSHIMSRLVEEVTNRGFTYFDWNISSGDAGQTTDSDVVYENVVYALKEGGSSVVLQHDVKDYSVDAVERIIQYGLEHGYVFAPLTADSFTAHHGVNN